MNMRVRKNKDKVVESHFSTRQLVEIRDFAKNPCVIHCGPFGCGKTFTLCIALGLYCMRTKPSKLGIALIGKTQQSVKRNICNELSKLFGKDFTYSKSMKDGRSRDAILFGHDLYIIGLNDASSEGKIRGVSIRGIFHDEVSTCTEEQFNLIFGRLRGEVEEGSTAEGTVDMWYVGATNPDSPKHWLKKVLDRDIPTGAIKYVRWLKEDASYRGCKEYYKSLKARYKGNPAFLNRYVYGMWTASDNMVYMMFNDKIHILNSEEYSIEDTMKNMRSIVLGVDYGVTNPTALVLVGRSRTGEYIVFKCRKFGDSTNSMILEEINKMLDYVKRCGTYVSRIYVDPSASGLKVEIVNSGISILCNANNDVMPGINYIRGLFSENKLGIFDTCEDVIEELYSYQFKDVEGKDVVVKKDDHCMDAMRYAIYTSSLGGV